MATVIELDFGSSNWQSYATLVSKKTRSLLSNQPCRRASNAKGLYSAMTARSASLLQLSLRCSISRC